MKMDDCQCDVDFLLNLSMPQTLFDAAQKFSNNLIMVKYKYKKPTLILQKREVPNSSLVSYTLESLAHILNYKKK